MCCLNCNCILLMLSLGLFSLQGVYIEASEVGEFLPRVQIIALWFTSSQKSQVFRSVIISHLITPLIIDKHMCKEFHQGESFLSL